VLGQPYDRLPGSAHPFKRAIKIGELIDAASRMSTQELKYAAFAAIPEYLSRGHGHKPVMVRTNFADRSKYMPRECFARGCR
ncbi:MAG: hypothetical protein WCO67_27020, partial [Betaproteobacteria bacterium]